LSSFWLWGGHAVCQSRAVFRPSAFYILASLPSIPANASLTETPAFLVLGGADARRTPSSAGRPRGRPKPGSWPALLQFPHFTDHARAPTALTELRAQASGHKIPKPNQRSRSAPTRNPNTRAAPPSAEPEPKVWFWPSSCPARGVIFRANRVLRSQLLIPFKGRNSLAARPWLAKQKQTFAAERRGPNALSAGHTCEPRRVET
jgi:hypothetical protein